MFNLVFYFYLERVQAVYKSTCN